VRGLSESLRQDLESTGSPVSMTCIHPGGIKTNIAKSSRMSSSTAAITGTDDRDTIANFEKMFITTPDKAAKTILNGVKKNKRRVLIGPDAHFLDIMVRLLPTSYQWIFTKVVSLQKKMNTKAA
jgi:short-subunit dehydrogenase